MRTRHDPTAGVIVAAIFAVIFWLGAALLGAQERVVDQQSAGFAPIPLTFEANEGQTDPTVKFLSRGSGRTLFLTATEAVLVTGGTRDALRLQLIGANAQASVKGVETLRAKSHYFLGNDPNKWRTNVPSYGKVRYSGIYPGIDLLYYGNPDQFEFDFIVEPGADPRRIRLKIDAAQKPSIDKTGDLVVKHGAREIRLRQPRIYQEINGHTIEIDGAYRLNGRDLRFRIGPYDRRHRLVIDPVLVYSTFLGGSQSDGGNAIAVDGAGNMYVTGGTSSPDFPSKGAYQQPLPSGNGVAFVTKLDPTQSGAASLVYSTFLGGTHGNDSGTGIAVNAAGQAHVAGLANSVDFPVTPSGFQTVAGSHSDGFVTKLNAAGDGLLYSTYLGGTSGEFLKGIALDASGHMYVAGLTSSADFPHSPNAFGTTLNGAAAVFVAKLDPAQSGAASRIYATYISGAVADVAKAIAVDDAGQAIVTGWTVSPDFPTKDALYGACGGCTARADAFVTQVNATGTGLVYSTFLGGSGEDVGLAVAVDDAGNAYITGYTESFGSTTTANFPLTASAYQSTPLGPYHHAFITKLNASGTALAYSTLFGGNFTTEGHGIAVDDMGNMHVMGYTESTYFPITADAFQSDANGRGVGPIGDAFVAKLDSNQSGANSLVYSTFLGGTSRESDFYSGGGIALDAAGNAYVTGATVSVDFPVTRSTAFQATNGDPNGFWVDGFVAKIAPGTNAADLRVAMTATPGSITVGDTVDYDLTVTNDGPDWAFFVWVTNELSTGQELVFISAGTVQSASNAPFSLGTLAPGATISVKVRARATAAGTIDNTATLLQASRDPDSTNDVSLVTVTVIGGANAGAGTPDLDGSITTGEWNNANCYTFNANSPGGGVTPAKLCVMNDVTNVYFSLTVDAEPGYDSFLGILLDNDNDGAPADGDDFFGAGGVVPYFDAFLSDGAPPCAAGNLCPADDSGNAGTTDGASAFQTGGRNTQYYELAHPLKSGDVRDAKLCPGDQIGFLVILSIYGPTSGDTIWPGPFQYTGITLAGECGAQTLPAGGTLTTDSEQDGATPDDVVETTLTSPAAGLVTIAEGSNVGAPPTGYDFLGNAVQITAPPAPVGEYLTIVFRIDGSAVPAGTLPEAIAVRRNGVSIDACSPPFSPYPLPCVSGRWAGGDVELTVYTAQASLWNFLLSNASADVTPPTVQVLLSPDVLWPANHKLVPVTATIDERDNSDPAPQVTLVSIVSSEPDDGSGDGNTRDDIQEASLGTDDRSFLLRAERAGGASGRIYTVTYRARDAAGNETTASAQVLVPSNRRK